MKYYFQLQWKRIGRILREKSIPPLIAILALFIFLGTLWDLIARDIRVAYGIVLLILMVPSMTQSRGRSEFLSMIFSSSDMMRIRMIEILLSSLPLLAILILRSHLLLALLGLAALGFSSLTHMSLPLPVIPHPYGRWPFEFARGVRKSFWIYPLAIFLVIMAWKSENPNLGLFAIALPVLINATFYIGPEHESYVEMHRYRPAAFLQHKMKVATGYTIATGVPFAIIHGFLFSNQWLYVLIILLAGLAVTLVSLLAKYAHYPTEIDIIQALALPLCIVFPPTALLIGPIFYHRAIRNLDSFLP